MYAETHDPKNTKPLGILMKSEQELSSLLNQMATKIPSESDSGNYYYLPFWFQVKPDGSIIAYHFDDIPAELKTLIRNQL